LGFAVSVSVVDPTLTGGYLIENRTPINEANILAGARECECCGRAP